MTTTDETTAPLRLVALDEDDLEILSAHFQDAEVPVRTRLPAVTEALRVGWQAIRLVKAAAGGCERCAVGLHFERVLRVACAGFMQMETERALNLLAAHFSRSMRRPAKSR